MSSLTRGDEAVDVVVTDDRLTVTLGDGRSISAPLEWFPRLKHAAAPERADWEIIGPGDGIHWPQLDEDISVRWLLTGNC